MHRAKIHKAMNKVRSSEDRISGLPDKVLGHILSYVPTKESVRTSILSKRWLSVWSNVPFLDLDDSSLSSTDLRKDQAIHLSFIQFLNNVFNLYEPGSLQKLALQCSKFDCYRVNDWVMAAMKHRVPHLDLCITIEHFDIAVLLFAYQYLADLKLGKGFALDLPGEVLLPCLKKLHLDSVEFLNDETCRRLLGGCPVLEYLHFYECDMECVETLEITAPQLESLVIQYVLARNLYFQVVVDAPNLKVLNYEGFMVKDYSFKNLNSLVTAYIKVDLYGMDKSNVAKISNISKSALKLVQGIANAKSITLAGYSLEVLSFLDPTALPVFNKCTKLKLGVNKHCGILLPKFLQNSPCLQKLVLAEDIDYEGVLGEFKWHNPAQVPKCLIYSLVSVEIRGYDGQRDMLKLVEYLVSNSKVLVELSSGSNKKKKHKELKVCKKLLSSLLKTSPFPK